MSQPTRERVQLGWPIRRRAPILIQRLKQQALESGSSSESLVDRHRPVQEYERWDRRRQRFARSGSRKIFSYRLDNGGDRSSADFARRLGSGGLKSLDPLTDHLCRFQIRAAEDLNGIGSFRRAVIPIESRLVPLTNRVQLEPSTATGGVRAPTTGTILRRGVLREQPPAPAPWQPGASKWDRKIVGKAGEEAAESCQGSDRGSAGRCGGSSSTEWRQGQE